MQSDLNGRVALLDTQNQLDWQGNGGDHRALQIAELLVRAGFTVRAIGRPTTTFVERHLRGLAVWRLRGYPIHLAPPERWKVWGRQAISNAGHFSEPYEKALAGTPQPAVFVWENSSNTFGASMARNTRCPVVAVPQNVYTAERGFRDYWLGRRGLRALGKELDFLKRCKGVFSISREEQWLLRIQGIDAEYLPYYPPTELEEFLRGVRSHRNPERNRRFLLIGSATHPPTERSMREQIEAICAIRAAAGVTLDVAGHGTERLRDAATPPNVVIHGTVTQGQLRELMIRTSAAILHQRPSVGALTRIPELLMAGVPVIANVDASRSTWDMKGIEHYESIEDLEPTLDRELPLPPMPDRPALAEARFCRAVQEVASAAT